NERDGYTPNVAEVLKLRSRALRDVLEPAPNALLENSKRIQAGLSFEKARVSDDLQDLNFQVEPCSAAAWTERRADLLARTRTRELAGRIVWLVRENQRFEDALVEQARANPTVSRVPER